MLEKVTITILTENRVTNPSLIAEQGLCFHIETPEGNFLFDTGQTNAFLHNAEHLGINLANLNSIILSQGHYDHTNGLYYYLKKFGKAEVLCHPNLFHKKFRLINGERMFIGISHEEDELKRLGAIFVFKTNPHKFSDSIQTTGEIHRITDYESLDESYQERVLESYIHDELNDDQALLLQTRQGLIILLGCAHRGVVNTVKHALRQMDADRIYAIMGGMHLAHAPMEKIQKIVSGLAMLNPRYVVPLHCTGFYAMLHMYRVLGDRVLLLNVGDRLTLAN